MRNLLFFVLSSIILAPLHAHVQKSWRFTDTKAKTIEFRLTPVDELDLQAAHQVFMEAFKKSYVDVVVETLEIQNLEQFLDAVFWEEIYQAEQNKETIQIVSAYDANTIVGIIFIELIDHQAEKYLYCREIVLNPQYWHRHIGEQLLLTALAVFPDIDELKLILRVENSSANGFYQKLGMEPCSAAFAEYPTDLYIGYKSKTADLAKHIQYH